MARVLEDHERIAALVEAVARAEAPDVRELHRLGEALTVHVRLEERELFPLVERELQAL